ncbi:polysaccharide biosynthesis tyrosine autokinase [Mycobacterium sp.]|uniref:polysaccharide biosynthesis tyrosine autokinase n=1 Tax=Mycobacterium sp. TaxID=1785 RepID=UPI0012795B40|nr:polysaccharide biosynthesis tyrosine autokinase [Mycobacterium sp.]KAA8966029.1 MAG: chain-length determining protein [Mycobacterium sp.]
MDFRTFVRILLERWKLAVGALLACLVGAAVITVFQNRAYQASATILLSISGETDVTDVYWGGQAAQDRLSTYAEIAGGRAVAERAVSQAQLAISPDTLVSETQVKYTPKSMLFTLTVTDTDPRRAAVLAAAMAESFVTLVPTLDATPRVQDGGTSSAPTAKPRVRASVVKRPEIPRRATRPVPMRNMAMGLVAGVLLGIVVALTREAGDRTVRTRRQLEQLSGLPTLAELPGRRTGVQRFGVDATVDDAVRDLRTRLLRAIGPEVRRLLVAGPFGGEGTTKTALNLALALAELGEDVLLVEGDTRRPVIAGLLKVNSQEGLADALAHPDVAARIMKPTPITKLFILASRSPRRETLPVNAYLPDVLDAVLQDLSSRCDRMVVDGPPVLATADTGLLAGAVQATVVVVRAGRTTVDELEDALSALRAAGARVVGTVLTDARVARHVRAAARMYRAKISGPS